MVQIVLIGIAAGAAAALLFASVISGSSFSLVLVSIAPLPLLIAALGWNHVAGLIAAVVAAALLAVAIGPNLFLPILIGVGLPAWWLAYLALLARQPAPAQPTPDPAHPAAGDTLEWYPVGRLVIWSALLASAVVTLSLIKIGFDVDTIRTTLSRIFEQIMRIQTGTPASEPLALPGINNPKRLFDVLALVFPPAAAGLATITNLMNLWLAARVVKISGRLKRPWPDLAAIMFPSWATALLVAAVVASFLPGLTGLVGAILAATMLTAYAVLGFAVLHKITGGIFGRGFVLASVYTAVGILGWPALVMTLLGIADTLIDVRGRVAARAARRQPPAT
jgi:predicted membrane protein DUF2232